MDRAVYSRNMTSDGTPDALPSFEGLKCPACEYDLTGLSECRCPECGTSFNPVELRAVMENSRLPGWSDRKNVGVVRAYAAVCCYTWFRPWKFGKEFPAIHNVREVTRFWIAVRIVFLVECLLMTAGWLMQYPSVSSCLWNWILQSLSGFLVAVLGSVMAEICVFAILTIAVFPRHRLAEPADRYHAVSWYALVVMFGTFMPLVFGAMVVFRIVFDWMHWPRNDLWLLFMAAGSAWWALALIAAAFTQSRPGKGRILAAGIILLIPASFLCLHLFR